ncbi:hypothetical protein [Streptomyces olivochromogenes]|uniref:hypothetical protein n=1 Tax=Streptomyces olivochromogenes TaxID=1963 RepID=UPI00369BC8E7
MPSPDDAPPGCVGCRDSRAESLVYVLEELAGEVVLTVVACLAVAGLGLAFVRGWESSPLITGGVGGALLVFLGYGGWELLRPARAGRRGRLAGVAALFVSYAWPCTCS